MESKNLFQFCFDVSLEQKLNTYIPTAYIVGHSETITYLEKKASNEVLDSFGVIIENLDANTRKALSICEALKPEAIFKKFSKNSKSSKNVEDLLKDDKLEFGIRQFIKTNLDQFYTLVSQEDFPLSLNLGKEKDFRISRITTKNPSLETSLQFDKHENGISYTLLLKDESTEFYPSNTNITLLLDEPGWLVAHHKLYQLKDINTKKIIPFLKKKTVEIPSKLVSEYFEKFIKDVAKKADIKATGFAVELKDKITCCSLHLTHDFFKNTYYFNFLFDYDGFTFDNSKDKKTHSEIETDNLDEIKVIQYKRTIEELSFENKLLELGFIKTENGLFGLSLKEQKQDPYATIQWAIDNQKTLESLNFSIEDLKIDSKKINTQKVAIQFSNEIKNDCLT